MEWRRDGFVITDDRDRVVLNTVVRFLRDESYWGRERSASVIQRSIQNSLCFSILDGARQVGFARFITDYAVFGYLEDVYIDDAYRGNGLGQWLMDCMLAHPDIKTLNRLMLSTADAHGLYTKYGFTALVEPDMVMERYRADPG